MSCLPESYGNYAPCPNCGPGREVAPNQTSQFMPFLTGNGGDNALYATPWGLKYPQQFMNDLNNSSRYEGDTCDYRERLRSIYDSGVHSSARYLRYQVPPKNPTMTLPTNQQLSQIYGPGKMAAWMAENGVCSRTEQLPLEVSNNFIPTILRTSPFFQYQNESAPGAGYIPMGWNGWVGFKGINSYETYPIPQMNNQFSPYTANRELASFQGLYRPGF